MLGYSIHDNCKGKIPALLASGFSTGSSVFLIHCFGQIDVVDISVGNML